jgi:hypothetical protein
MQQESKPLPSAELSLKFMSWDVKKLGESVNMLQQVLDQKLSEIATVLREINKNCSKTPF